MPHSSSIRRRDKCQSNGSACKRQRKHIRPQPHAGYQRNRNEAQVPDELELHAIARERTYARGPKQTSNSIGMREKYQRWTGKWKKRMEEAEAAKAGQRAAAELPK